MGSGAVLDRQRIRKILIRSTNWIGDAVMTTPAMETIRVAFPQAEVVVAANPIVAELLSPHPWCDRVLVFDKKGEHQGLKGLVRFAVELRRERFDMAVLFQNAIEAAIMTFLAGIPRRVGYRTDGRGFLLTHGVAVGAAERRLHHTRYYVHMLERVGIHGGKGRQALSCTPQERAWAKEVLGEDAWVAINPGAAYGSAKRWFADRFAAVADALAEEFRVRILLTGGPGETDIGRDIERTMRVPPLNRIGKTSVRQMMALLSCCRLMVTNDSGPMHVAAALGVPLVALFGPTDPTTTSPLAESWRMVRKPADCAPCRLRQCPVDHRCMTAITSDDVLEAARALWKNQDTDANSSKKAQGV